MREREREERERERQGWSVVGHIFRTIPNTNATSMIGNGLIMRTFPNTHATCMTGNGAGQQLAAEVATARA